MSLKVYYVMGMSSVGVFVTLFALIGDKGVGRMDSYEVDDTFEMIMSMYINISSVEFVMQIFFHSFLEAVEYYRIMVFNGGWCLVTKF